MLVVWVWVWVVNRVGDGDVKGGVRNVECQFQYVTVIQISMGRILNSFSLWQIEIEKFKTSLWFVHQFG